MPYFLYVAKKIKINKKTVDKTNDMWYTKQVVTFQ